jgi:hypothetical protein
MALTTEDQLAIQGLAARYNFAVDSGDGEAFAATFVEAGVLDLGPTQIEGRPALQEFAEHFPTTRRSPRHVSDILSKEDGAWRFVQRNFTPDV